MVAAASLGKQNHLRSRPEGPDPRFLQATFGFVFVTGVLVKSESNGSLPPQLAYAAVIAALLTGATFLIRGRHAHGLFAMVAVVDIALGGLARTAPDAAGLGLLALLPVLWLGYRFGRAAAVLAFGALLACVSLPAVFVADGLDQALPAFVLPPAAAVVLIAATKMTERVDRLRNDAEVKTAQLGAIMTSVSLGVIVMDDTGHITTINPHGREILAVAYPGEPTLDLPMVPNSTFALDGVTPLAEEQRPTVRAARGEEFTDVQLWIGPDPESRRAVSVTSRRLRSADRRLPGQVMVIQDITDLVLATQARDRFLSAASHELRTPLMIVLSHADLLATRTDIDMDDFPEIAAISRGADRLSRLVADIMRVAELPPDQASAERLLSETQRVLDPPYARTTVAKREDQVPTTRSVEHDPV